MNEILGYGYENDEEQMKGSSSNIKFGLNENVFMTGFELVNNAGAGGSDGEALDITYNINGTEKRDRLFPVTQAYDKKNNIVTDRNNPAFKKALSELNAKITHVMKAFVTDEVLKAALSSPIASFQQYVNILAGILPADYDKIPLDIFMQYEYTIKGNNDRTWLTFPKKVNYGNFLCRHIDSIGEWKAITDGNGLHYEDDNHNMHLFKRNKWFMDSNFATQQKEANPLENLAAQGTLKDSNPEVNQDNIQLG